LGQRARVKEEAVHVHVYVHVHGPPCTSMPHKPRAPARDSFFILHSSFFIAPLEPRERKSRSRSRVRSRSRPPLHQHASRAPGPWPRAPPTRGILRVAVAKRPRRTATKHDRGSDAESPS
jgi:hypothetical protein